MQDVIKHRKRLLFIYKTVIKMKKQIALKYANDKELLDIAEYLYLRITDDIKFKLEKLK